MGRELVNALYQEENLTRQLNNVLRLDLFAAFGKGVLAISGPPVLKSYNIPDLPR